MFLFKVILLSHIVFTVTSAAVCGGRSCIYKCCGENKDRCRVDCTGVTCTSDSHCGDECCIGGSYFFKGNCGACHKTRHCRFHSGFGAFCRLKCCGSNSNRLKCLNTCDGTSCKSNNHCDGECCVGNEGNKTCGLCPPTPCTRNFECTTNCCRFGTCYSKENCSERSTTERPTSPPTRKPECTQNLDCATKCCRFGTCYHESACGSNHNFLRPPTLKPPSKASSSVDFRKIIIIPIGGIIFLVILVVSFFRCRKKGVTNHEAPQLTRSSRPPPSYVHRTGPVTIYNDTNHMMTESTRPSDPPPPYLHSADPVNAYNNTNHEATQMTMPSGPPPPYVQNSTEPVTDYNDTSHGSPQNTRPPSPPPPYLHNST